MNKSILIAAGFLLCISCSKDQNGTNKDNDVQDINFVFTRAIPTDNTTFGFMAYYSQGDITEPAGVDLQATGTYRYHSTDRTTLIPCHIKANGEPDTGFKDGYDPNSGLRLVDGTYRVHMYSPAFAIVNNGKGSLRIRYTRTSPIKVSSQPFLLTVNNYRTYPVPTESFTFQDVISDFTFEFVQKSGTFTVAKANLLNTGTTAYYQPLLKINDIIDAPGPAQPLNLTPTGNTGTDQVVFRTDAANVFPTDYTQDNTLALILQFDLSMGGQTVTISLPIAMTVDPSMHYTFTINVYSTFIQVSYRVASWVDHSGSDSAGGSGVYTQNLGTFTIIPWDTGGSSSTSVG